MIPLISIIVPIYNVEQYLTKCLQSIAQQSLQEIEIICIDDCSPDNSNKIVTKHIKIDSRISLITHKENTGQGGARNTGIMAAKADYILCVDSDDSLQPNMLKTLWDATGNGEYDVICCGYKCVNEKGDILSHHSYPASVHKNDNHEFNIFSFNTAPWNKLWKKSVFIQNNIWFPHHMHYQDLATIPRLFCKAKTIKVIEDKLYLYLIRDNSVTTTFSARHIFDYVKVFEIIIDFLKEEGLSIHYQQELTDMVGNHLHFHATNVAKSNMAKPEKKYYLQILLMLKLSFLKNHLFLKSVNRKHLLSLIKDAHATPLLNKSKLGQGSA